MFLLFFLLFWHNDIFTVQRIGKNTTAKRFVDQIIHISFIRTSVWLHQHDIVCNLINHFIIYYYYNHLTTSTVIVQVCQPGFAGRRGKGQRQFLSCKRLGADRRQFNIKLYCTSTEEPIGIFHVQWRRILKKNINLYAHFYCWPPPIRWAGFATTVIFFFFLKYTYTCVPYIKGEVSREPTHLGCYNINVHPNHQRNHTTQLTTRGQPTVPSPQRKELSPHACLRLNLTQHTVQGRCCTVKDNGISMLP